MPKPLVDTETLADAAAALAEAHAAGDVLAAEAASLALHAADAANAGRLGDARRDLGAALIGTADLRLLFLGFQFHFRAALAPGTTPSDKATLLDEAERLVRSRLSLTEAMFPTPHCARALTNLGLVLQFKGSPYHAEAEECFMRAVSMDRALNDTEGLARDLGNLGNFYESTGLPHRAEPLYREALELALRIGALHIAAGQLINLGELAAATGDSALARTLWSKAAGICREQGYESRLQEAEARLASLNPR